MQSYADALSAKGYRSFGFDTDMEMDMDMGCTTMRRIEKRKGGKCLTVGVAAAGAVGVVCV
ncbi:GD24514 [Drosophila simulans]|uniref:GD24514 n=1 Tax=Drosophila simulans TaxID=7240 RepID=B4NUF3_DROSI|nr:GD24514 [Drosophila simulans]